MKKSLVHILANIVYYIFCITPWITGFSILTLLNFLLYGCFFGSEYSNRTLLKKAFILTSQEILGLLAIIAVGYILTKIYSWSEKNK